MKLKTPMLILAISIFLSVVSAYSPPCYYADDQIWTVPGTTTQVCLPWDYEVKSACCVGSDCTKERSYYFCIDDGNLGGWGCNKGSNLLCCPDAYPKYDSVTKMCWKASWQCIQGPNGGVYNEDCSKVSPNAWCSGTTCVKPKCEADSDCGAGNYCSKPDPKNPKTWTCAANLCYNKQCPDKCEGSNWLTNGQCNVASGNCQYQNNGVQIGKCNAQCLVDLNCGTTGYVGDRYCGGPNNLSIMRRYIANTCDSQKPGTNIYTFLPDGTVIWNNAPTYQCKNSDTIQTLTQCDWKCVNGACVIKTYNTYYRYEYNINECRLVGLNVEEVTPNDYPTKAECEKNVEPFVYKFENQICNPVIRQSGPYVFSTKAECEQYMIKPSLPITNSSDIITITNNQTGEKTEIVTGEGVTTNLKTTGGKPLRNDWLIWAIVGGVAVIAGVAYAIQFARKRVRISIKRR